jgi:hypothetical protein
MQFPGIRPMISILQWTSYSSSARSTVIPPSRAAQFSMDTKAIVEFLSESIKFTTETQNVVPSFSGIHCSQSSSFCHAGILRVLSSRSSEITVRTSDSQRVLRASNRQLHRTRIVSSIEITGHSARSIEFIGPSAGSIVDSQRNILLFFGSIDSQRSNMPFFVHVIEFFRCTASLQALQSSCSWIVT